MLVIRYLSLCKSWFWGFIPKGRVSELEGGQHELAVEVGKELHDVRANIDTLKEAKGASGGDPVRDEETATMVAELGARMAEVEQGLDSAVGSHEATDLRLEALEVLHRE